MPNRMVREGILDSERVDQLSMAAEVFYRRLMSVVDDFGRFDARPDRLIAACFPLRARKQNSDGTLVLQDGHIEAWLVECVNAGLLSRYSVAGKPYLEVLDFGQQVRAKASKYPDPPTPPRPAPPPAKHVRSTCIADAQQPPASAHLGEGEGGVEDGDVVEGGGAGGVGGGGPAPASPATAAHPPPPTRAATPKSENPKTPPPPPTEAERWAEALRALGVQCHPNRAELLGWIAERKPLPEVIACVAVARERKPAPEPIPLRYLAAIVADPPKAQVRGPPWWESDAGMAAKCVELGISGAQPGEEMPDFRRRINEAIERKKREERQAA